LKFLSKIEIVESEPVVSYRETVSTYSSQVCLTKSSNKLNRIFMTAEPLPEELCSDIENKIVSPNDDIKERSKYLNENYGWDLGETKKIWFFGPYDNGPNVIVDMTKAIQNLNDVKGSMGAAFQKATRSGVLCEEETRGIRYNIIDVLLHTDSVHRGDGQIMPAARRAFCAAQLSASPRLLEPMYLCEIQTELDVVNSVYSVIAGRRGTVVNQIHREGTPIVVLKTYVPVANSFGLTAELRKETSGKAFPQCSFDHWNIMDGDPLDTTSKVHKVIEATRRRKGLPEKFPILADYVDKL